MQGGKYLDEPAGAGEAGSLIPAFAGVGRFRELILELEQGGIESLLKFHSVDDVLFVRFPERRLEKFDLGGSHSSVVLDKARILAAPPRLASGRFFGSAAETHTFCRRPLTAFAVSSYMPRFTKGTFPGH